jgi:uncharacterized protein DUF4157
MRHLIRIGHPGARWDPWPLPVQRDGPLTLNTPGLGQSDPAAKYRLGGNLKLELDPALQARLWQQIDQELDPTKVRPALGKMSYMGPGFPKLPTPAAAAAASSAGSAPATNPFTLPAIPEPAPLVPKGEGPDKPRAGEPGDIAEAIAAVPAVDQALTGLKDQAKTKVLTDWARLSGGEKAITVSAIALVGAGTIAGIASDPDARRLALNQLNGKVLPVPKVPWMRVEVNTGPDNFMVGIHVDVGTLLPSSLGFGPGSPEAMGGPPTQRQAVEGVGSAPGDTGARGVADEPRSTAERIRAAAAGSGAPLPPELRRSFGQELGADLSGVRLHTGAEADRLACLLDARAFTTGSDIFFREGALDPGSAAGQRLLAHEAVHTVQQATGRVEGTPVVGAGVLLSDPGDRFEREAVRKAAMLTRRS